MAWTLWPWVCVFFGWFVVVDGQSQDCCAQCKLGFVYEDNTRKSVDSMGYSFSHFCTSLAVYCTAALCSTGQYQRWNYCGKCAFCPAGKKKKDLHTCESCSAGYECYDGQQYACNSGQISGSGQAACTYCADGKYASSDHTTCITCEKGYRCVGGIRYACDTGAYMAEEGSSFCYACYLDEYQPSTGQLACILCTTCLPGQYVSTVSCTGYPSIVDRGCTACPAGSYSTSNNAGSCTPCPDGQFQGNAGQTSCNAHVPCVAGQKTKSVGTRTTQFQCENCPQYFTTVLGSERDCDKCVAGRYMGTKTVGLVVSADCIQCPHCNMVGTYINCPVGTTSSSTSMCMFCSGTQAGSYCPVGQEEGGCDGTQLGNVACKDCRAGHHKPVQDTKNCVKCPTGTFKVSPGTASCGACTNGPRNSYYGAWGGSQLATSNECPW
jgi:hypothetical protein